MQIKDLPRNTKIRVLADPDGQIITFHNMDGMYSYCTTEDNEVVHLAAWQEVEIINPQKK